MNKTLQRAKLRKQRFNEIKQKKQNINNDFFREHFKYQSPSDMYKKLNETENTERHNMQII